VAGYVNPNLIFTMGSIAKCGALLPDGQTFGQIINPNRRQKVFIGRGKIICVHGISRIFLKGTQNRPKNVL
jgi:hypothetical protein